MELNQDTKTDYGELEDTLIPLGFIHGSPGFFSHEILNFTFDFSACSIQGAMRIVFDKGVEYGAEGAKQQIRESLGL